ncbi:MAG: hypothetical protein HUU50_12255 [Candidatus Brocadiae bacterium]|nr:hypothetical protein [Candidatus Brocadiia bacterium]
MARYRQIFVFLLFVIAIELFSVEVWLTEPENSLWLEKQGDVFWGIHEDTADYTIEVEDTKAFQKMDGFGASLTESSCYLLMEKLSQQKRADVLEDIFGERGIHLSLLRQPMGASDFALSAWTYNDTKDNADDMELSKFSLAREEKHIRPVLNQACQISPGRIKIFASPWSPPAWMKTQKHLYGKQGGVLRHDCYDVYAEYFIRFLQAYQAKGTPVYCITIQNEPEYAPLYPGMLMSQEEQSDFIPILGTKLLKNGLDTKIAVYDHNYDNILYPQSVIEKAGSYISGSAFHYYCGLVHENLTKLHEKHPDKEIWATECGSGTWIGGGSISGMFQDLVMHTIRFPRNWAKSYIMWNVALDAKGGPILMGPDSPNQGLITIQSWDQVTYNLQYYGLGHSSKFVDPGAYRVYSKTFQDKMESVSYKNPDGSKALLVLNRENTLKKIKVQYNKQSFIYAMPSQSAATFYWK